MLVDEYDSFNNEYLDSYHSPLKGSVVEKTLESFWNMAKELTGSNKGIPQTFITGISPASLSDIISGYNIGRNLSLNKNLSELCGLTRNDVEAALKEACSSDLDTYQNKLSTMTEFFNGYHFSNKEKVETIYNTMTCMGYLQVRSNT